MYKQQIATEVLWLGIYISDESYEDALVSLEVIKKHVLEERDK